MHDQTLLSDRQWEMIQPLLPPEKKTGRPRSLGRQIAPMRSGSGVIEKNIEVKIARRFKRQGRSWTPSRGRTRSPALLVAKQSGQLDPLVAQNRFS
jgi:hypothetical protein